jgi:hypothetical protein
MSDAIFANPLVSAIIGGSIVAIISAFLARKKMQSEIEIQQLLRAYSLLQEAVAFIGDMDDLHDMLEKMDEKSRFEMIDRTGEAVVILDLLGSREVLKAIRSSNKDVEGKELSMFDITSVQTVLRRHIRKKLGLPTFGIPRQFAIAPARSIGANGDSHEPQETTHRTADG